MSQETRRVKASAWPSLTAHLELSKQLFGETGPKRVQDWLNDQMARIDDPAFARLFTDHAQTQGRPQKDFNHRHVTAQTGALLGGIRFFGGDPDRPYVEVIAHTFPENAQGMAALSNLVGLEWHTFRPKQMRLLLTNEHVKSLPENPGMRLDMSIHIARYKDMPAPSGVAGLARFGSAEAAMDLVQQRYRDVAKDDPERARNISAADPEDILDWYNAGQAHAITAGSETVGLIAIAPGAVSWIDGDEIEEEVIATPHTGQGYAAQAQKSWAASAKNRNRLLLGTIDHLNPASRKTAEAAGRHAALSYIFVDLPTA